jgi:hypothetical protein
VDDWKRVNRGEWGRKTAKAQGGSARAELAQRLLAEPTEAEVHESELPCLDDCCLRCEGRGITDEDHACPRCEG